MLHEHLDQTISIRYGPHVVARYDREGKLVRKGERRGKGGPVEAVENQGQVSHRSHSALEISPTPRDSHFSTAPTTVPILSSPTQNQARRAS